MKYFLPLLYIFIIIDESNAQWTQTNLLAGGRVTGFTVKASNLFVGNATGVFRSTDNGTSWDAMNTDLPSTEAISLASSTTNLFVGIYHYGVYRSTNNGTNWSTVNTEPATGFAYSLIVCGTNLYAGTPGGVYLSTNNGTSWIHTSLPNSYSINTFATYYSAAGDTSIFAGSNNGGVFISTDNGTNWKQVNSGLTNISINSLIIKDTILYAATDGGGVFLSTNYGENWLPFNSGLTNSHVNYLTSIDTSLLAGTDGDGVFLFMESDTNWRKVNNGLMDTSISCLAINGSYLFAGTYSGAIWKRPLSEIITSVEKPLMSSPEQFDLSQNYPNPFNPTTNISFVLPMKLFVELKVYNIIGKEVANIVSEELPAGKYSKIWNASKLSSGVYFYCLRAGQYRETKKLILLK